MVRWLLWIYLCSLGIAECMLTPVQLRPAGAAGEPGLHAHRRLDPRSTCTCARSRLQVQVCNSTFRYLCTQTSPHVEIQGSVNTNKHVLPLSLLKHLLQSKDRGISTKSPPYLSASVSLPTPFPVSLHLSSTTPLLLYAHSPHSLSSPPQAPYYYTKLQVSPRLEAPTASVSAVTATPQTP